MIIKKTPKANATLLMHAEEARTSLEKQATVSVSLLYFILSKLNRLSAYFKETREQPFTAC